MREPIFGGVALITALTLGFACGGNVVVDPEGSGGAGGAPMTTTTTTTSNGEGGSGAACGAPAPIGQVFVCAGTGSSGPGGPPECGTSWCDEGGNVYGAWCTPDACSCEYNFQTLCTCANDGGDICGGSAAICCPFPF